MRARRLAAAAAAADDGGSGGMKGEIGGLAVKVKDGRALQHTGEGGRGGGLTKAVPSEKKMEKKITLLFISFSGS